MLHFPRWKIILTLSVCLLFALTALPNVLSPAARQSLPEWMPSNTVNLGLDLQGGSHLLLRVGIGEYLKEQLDELRDNIRKELRSEKIGYKGLSVRGGAVLFTVRPETLGEVSVMRVLNKLDRGLEVSSEGNQYTVRFSEMQRQEKLAQLMEQSIEIINRRINETGVKEPTVQRQGDDRILLQVPGVEDPEMLKSILGKTAKMTFHLVNENVTPEQMMTGPIPPDTDIMASDDKDDILPDGSTQRYAIYKRVELSGDLLTNANATFDRGQPIVEFQFNAVGGRKFGEITQNNVGKRFAVVLDNKVITAPVIRSAILGSRGIIEGNFTVESANELALLLRAGALPAPLDIMEERTVGPSLGNDSIEAGKKAAIIAIVMVAVFMLLFYGLFGIFANIALTINLVLILGALSLLQATLTLPGIAGIVLTLGMAVDANVLIYERIREEIAVGKTPLASVDSGFKAAFSTILDSNLTTLIAAAILFYFGTGTIRGFAVTLSIGILSSMFTAILLTRLIVITWLKSVRPKAIPL